MRPQDPPAAAVKSAVQAVDGIDRPASERQSASISGIHKISLLITFAGSQILVIRTIFWGWRWHKQLKNENQRRPLGAPQAQLRALKHRP